MRVYLLRQQSLRLSLVGRLGVPHRNGCDGVYRKTSVNGFRFLPTIGDERQAMQQGHDVGVSGLQQVLVQHKWARAAGVQPNLLSARPGRLGLTALPALLPIFSPAAVVSSGSVMPCAAPPRNRRTRSQPAVMLPHWSLPPT